MINVATKLLDAWSELLDGNISVNVYRSSAPMSEIGNYVLLRMESETNKSNNHSIVTNPIVITDVVTRFPTVIDETVAIGIDTEIGQLLKSDAARNNLSAQSGIQIVNVVRQSGNYLDEDDGVNKYYRIVTRNYHRIVQT